MIVRCSCCGDDMNDLVKDTIWGWVCSLCHRDLDMIDRETDWDEYEAQKRERIAESIEE